MTDIVQRLRESAEAGANEVDTRKEAADEIERLRAKAEKDEAMLRQAMDALEILRYGLIQMRERLAPKENPNEY